jgi:RHS repeat-associated protein
MYLQRIWMGESLDGWDESYPTTTSNHAIVTEGDVDLQWGPKAYTYDGAGNITQIATDSYVYDSAGRLIRATVNNKTQDFQYDAFGNLTRMAVAGSTPTVLDVDAGSNRLKNQAYDAAGNVTTGDEGRRSYVYDSLNMLTRTQLGNEPERRIIYDPSDERIGWFYPGDTQSRWMIRDLEGRVIREYKGEQLTTWYWQQDEIYGEGSLVAGETQEFGLNAPGAFRYGGRRHYHLDHLGSVRMVTNDDGRSVSEHEYYPFGVTQTRSFQEEQSPGSHVDPMRFAGHAREFLGSLNVETTEYLDYMHARYYDPNWGRFLSVDPIVDVKKALVEPRRWNRYSYVTNNPLRYTDPDGKERQMPFCVQHPAQCSADELSGRAPAGNQVLWTGAVAGGVLVGPALAAEETLELGLLMMRNPGTVLAAMKLLDAVGGNASSHINPTGQTGNKLGYLLGKFESSGGKGGLFAGVLGFGERTLDAAVRSHFAENFAKGELQANGRLEVTGAMAGANGVVRTITTIWQWNQKTKVWDLITGYQAK